MNVDNLGKNITTNFFFFLNYNNLFTCLLIHIIRIKFNYYFLFFLKKNLL